MNLCKNKTGFYVHELQGLHERILAKTLAAENTQCIELIELDENENSNGLLEFNTEETSSFTVVEKGSIWKHLLGKKTRN